MRPPRYASPGKTPPRAGPLANETLSSDGQLEVRRLTFPVIFSCAPLPLHDDALLHSLVW